MSRRIAIVGACPYPVPQGSQVYLRDTALALHHHGHQVHLVVYGYGMGECPGGLTIHRCARIPGARRIAAGPSPGKPVLDLALARTLRRVARRERIDLVIAHNYEGLAVALAARARPILYMAHNAMADELPHYFREAGWARRFGSWLDHTLPYRADRIVAPHAALAEYLVACGCAAGRVSVIAPPAPIEAFDPPAAVDSDLAPVLYTGNLDAYQNLPFLSRVMERVREALPEARLVVATSRPVRLDGAEMVSTPDFETVRDALAQDAVVVCPRVSWSGYPIKLLNAMAAGRPIVVCRSAAHPIVDGESGIVVQDNDEEAFASALIRLIQSPDERTRLGAAARFAAERSHHPDQTADALEAAFPLPPS